MIVKISFCEFSSIGVTIFMAHKHSRFCTFRPQLFNCSLCKAPVMGPSPADAPCLSGSAGEAQRQLRRGHRVGEGPGCGSGVAPAPRPLRERYPVFPAPAPGTRPRSRCVNVLRWLLRSVCSPQQGRKIVRLCRLVA